MIIAYAKMALSALEASSSWIKIAVAAGIAIALVVIYGAWHHQVYEAGIKDALLGIAREDDKLIDRALEYRGRWQTCRSSGGVWDQSTGSCAR